MSNKTLDELFEQSKYHVVFLNVKERQYLDMPVKDGMTFKARALGHRLDIMTEPSRVRGISGLYYSLIEKRYIGD